MPDQSLAGRSVLVVEDEYMMASDLTEALEAAGAAVIGPAPTVQQAMSAIASQADVHAAVLDVNLSGEMVYPLADFLADRGVRFLFTTGYDADTIPPRFNHVSRLEKPIGPADVVKAVVRLVDRS
ncbi:response regulator [Phenylobacterium sp. LjRoot164]|uniref:response regulator n=1 Tax=unclassified Phenylobacterium TaxID=2640670 RepID=UPI003ECF74BD